MQVDIAARHVPVTAELRGYVEHLAERLEHLFDGVGDLHVALHAEKGRRTAELVATVRHGQPIVAKVTHQSLYAAIHEAADKIEAQLRKHKDKLRDRRGRDRGTESAPPPSGPGTAEGADGPADVV